MQIYEYVSCYFVGFALSLLVLYISGVKRKLAIYFFAANSIVGFVSSIVFIALEKADALLLVAGGFGGITGEGILCLIRFLSRIVIQG